LIRFAQKTERVYLSAMYLQAQAVMIAFLFLEFPRFAIRCPMLHPTTSTGHLNPSKFFKDKPRGGSSPALRFPVAASPLTPRAGFRFAPAASISATSGRNASREMFKRRLQRGQVLAPPGTHTEALTPRRWSPTTSTDPAFHDCNTDNNANSPRDMIANPRDDRSRP
jgi:hypothetical protein